MSTSQKVDLADIQKQRRQLDDNRQSHLTDVEKVREQVDALLHRRMQEGDIDRNDAARDYMYLCGKFPKVLDALLTYKQSRLQEFQEIIHTMLDGIAKVQKGELSQYDCSDKIENDLSGRFYKKDG